MDFSGIVKEIALKAKENKKRIVLPESNDLRILNATKVIVEEEIADIVLIGDVSEIEFLCKANNIDLDISKVEICNPLTDERRNIYIETLYELRKHKGISMPEIIEKINDNVYFAMMMLKFKEVDGLVSGAIHSTADTLRPAFEIIKTEDNIKYASSYFIMEVPDCGLENNLYIFSDCGVIEDPTSEQLAEISKSSAKSSKDILGIDPKVAFLSYSTHGSAKSEKIDKIKEAIKLLDEEKVDFEYDGELQVDAALVKSVRKLKSPSSKLQENANVLIFPDLQAGNIGYKLVQRFTGGTAIGPVVQGLAMPVNDLSRGCNIEEIVALVSVTSMQAIMKGEKDENISN